jgi:hypothetical protein
MPCRDGNVAVAAGRAQQHGGMTFIPRVAHEPCRQHTRTPSQGVFLDSDGVLNHVEWLLSIVVEDLADSPGAVESAAGNSSQRVLAVVIRKAVVLRKGRYGLADVVRFNAALPGLVF